MAVDQEQKYKKKSWVEARIRELDYEINTLHRHNLSIECTSIAEVTYELHLSVSAGVISFSDGMKYDNQLDRLFEKQKRNYLQETHPEELEEENKYFTEEKLQEAVGEQGMQQIEEVTIKPGEAFMNGETTNVNYQDPEEKEEDIPAEISNKESSNSSSYSSSINLDTANKIASIINDGGTSLIADTISNAAYNIGKSQPVALASKATAAGLGTYGIGKELVNNAPEIITTLATAIISKSVEIVTEEVTKMGTTYLANHMQYITSFPMKVNSYAMSYFNANKMSIGDILKSFNESSEERIAQLNEKNEKKGLSEFISKAQDKSKKFMDKINGFIDTGTSYISMVTAYIQNGPDWVIDQVDKQITDLLSGAQKEIDKQWEKDKKAYDEKAKTLGDKAGRVMVDKYNKALTEAQKKGVEKIKKMKTKTAVKLFTVKAKAVSQIASMTGIYIPV